METENIRIYDEKGNPKGIAARQAIHEKGYWHETFHCWLAGRQGDGDVVYLQLRSKNKKDFPGLFDITAAGHLLADETVEDGIREVREELGISVNFDELTPLGMVKDRMALSGFIDNERCHCFLYNELENIDLRFELQVEEVSGMAKLDFGAFAALLLGEKERVAVKGFEITPDGRQQTFNKDIGLKDLVPHSAIYLERIIELISRELKR